MSRGTTRLVLAAVAAALVLCVGVTTLVLAIPAVAHAEATAGGTGAGVPAHPLGNFTVNHYNGLRVYPSRVENTAIVDFAELPTLQARPSIDLDGSGSVAPAEATSYSRSRCAELAAAQRLLINGVRAPWRVESVAFGYQTGQGGLQTSKLTCTLSALTSTGTGTPAAVEFTDAYLTDRIGWHEITAGSNGVRLAPTGLPSVSVSDELRKYPDDLLASPLNQRSAKLRVSGSGDTGSGPARTDAPAGYSLGLSIGGPIEDALAALDRTFTDLIGTSSLTVPLGLLAVLLAVVLGAGHALIPGHGKTIMAAYLAGQRGRPRDALVVGTTVTLTHTVGVLVVGLLLSAFTALAGESVLSWLGLASGLLIAVVGARLLWSAFRPSPTPPHTHGRAHLHGHGHSHAASNGHADVDGHRGGFAGSAGRGGLIGLGIAGGLVPSPSALIVLLGAIGLGRTWFGIALVAAYGLGMAATLTATGLLLVKLAGRLDRLALRRQGLVGRIAGLAPVGTAAMVVVLGTGLAVRSLAGAI